MGSRVYLWTSTVGPAFPCLHGHKAPLGQGIYGGPYISEVSAFTLIRGAPRRLLSASADSLPPAQNSWYAKVAYLGKCILVS